MRYFLVAGETSGDLHGANLIRALKKEDPQAEFSFVGGDEMAKASGISPVVHCQKIAVMGFIAVLQNIKRIALAGEKMQEALWRFRPDRIIAIDSSGFNFRYLLPFAKKHFSDIPLIYYIVPKLWAWRSHRVKVLQRYVTRLLVIFPFEESYFREKGLDTLFIGNPSIESVGDYLSKNVDREKRGVVLDSVAVSSSCQNPIVALLPGSRKQEIRDNLPLMLHTITSFYPDYIPIIAGINQENRALYQKICCNYPSVKLLFGQTYSLLSVADFAIVTSGTATLETALIGTPQVVCYKMGGSRWMNWLFKRMIKVPFFSLVNLVAGREVVKELLSADATAQNLCEALGDMMDNPSKIKEEYKGIYDKLSKGKASINAAKAILATSAKEVIK